MNATMTPPARHDVLGGAFMRWALWAPMATLAVICAYPLYFVLVTALKEQGEYAANPLALPTDPTVAPLVEAWEVASAGRYTVNSFLIVGAACLLLLVVSSLAGYAFAQMRFPLRGAGLLAMVALMMIPPSVIMVPIFRRVVQVGLLSSYTGLILVYAGLQAPFSIYMMASYFRGIPAELLDAAEVDGAGKLSAFVRIALPLARPALLTLLTLNFLWLWNELLFALILMQEAPRRTLMVGIALLPGQHGADVPLIAAGLLFAMAPPLLMFALFHRQLAEGLTAGALK